MNLLKKIIRFDNFIKILLFTFAVVFALGPLSDWDMFFHIKNGQNIFYYGIPQTDPYSMHSGLVFMQHEWLSDIIFYLIYAIAGFTSLWLFKVIFVICFFFAIYYVLRKMTDNNKFISFIASGFIAVLCIAFYVIRPQLFSYILFLSEILLLERYEQTKEIKYLYGLPIIALLLINLHGAVMPLFFVFAGVYIFSNLFGKLKIDKIANSTVTKKENIIILLFILGSFLV